MAMTKEALLEAVKLAATDGKLACGTAHELGSKLGVSLQEIGAACNELKIRIKECQLGCF